MQNQIIKNKAPNFAGLVEYGFKKTKNGYEFSKNIMKDEFKLTVNMSFDGVLSTQLSEISTKEIYTLHLLEGAKGSFVGKVREEYNAVINDILGKCFVTDVFKSRQAKQILEYVKDKYESEPEYLWEKFPDNAVCRRSDNKKWYLAILTVKKSKLGFDTEEMVEVIDLRAKSDELPEMIKKDNIFAGYHMNKKHWISVILDNSMKTTDIYELIDHSYELAKK